MNYLKNLSLKSWLYIVVFSSIMICIGISWIYFKQKETIKQEIKISENIRQARIDLTKGFLHISLSGNINSPYKQEVGIAYINQAVKKYEQSLTFENQSKTNTVSATDRVVLKTFIASISDFQSTLKQYNYSEKSKPKLELDLRIQFYHLEKQSDQIEDVINLNINTLSSNLNTDFLTALFIAISLFVLICIVFLNLILKINKSNKELEDSQKQIKSISDNLVNGMIYQVTMIDKNQRKFNYISNTVNQLYGCSPQEALNNPALVYSKIHPDDLDDFILAEKEAFKYKVTFKKEARVINPDKTIRWSYFVSHPHINEETVCWDGIEIDITEQKQMELELLASKKQIEKSEENYRIATEATKDGIWEWNLETNEARFSKRFYEIWGVESDSDQLHLSYDDWENRIHPKDKDYVLQAIKNHLEKGVEYNVEYRHLHTSDTYRWQNSIGKAIFDDNGKPLRMIGSIRDINKNKIAEENLFEERNVLKNILESMSDAFVSIDKNWQFTSMNSKATKILGSTPNELIGKVIWHEFPELESHPFCSNLKKVMENKVSVQIEEYYTPFDKWLELSIFPTKNGISIFFSDISKRKQIELELVKAKEKAEESDRLKSAFLANMSHEIRTPMNGILGFSSLLSEPGLGEEEQHEYIKLIQISGARMLNLISEIIDISKIESGMMEINLEEIKVNQRMEFVYNLLKLDAEEKSIQLSWNCALENDLSIVTDPEKLYAILTNLVKNAIKYTDAGTIEFGYTIKKEFVEFFVKDTGIGIPKELQATIFERFIQVDIANIQARQGAGLGLAIVKAFVNLLGGKIWVESQQGVGSTFTFTLPIKVNNEVKTAKVEGDKKIEKLITAKIKSKLKILIADDDAISRKLILKSIHEFGREIIEAKTGLEAVEIFKENQDIDLILMDIQMPVMNGYEATHEIRKINSDVILITQSAFGLTGDREKSILAGSTDYISKPINKNELLGLISKYFS